LVKFIECFLNFFSAKNSKLKTLKKYVAHSLSKEQVKTLFFTKTFLDSLLRNHNSNLSKEKNNKINVLPQHAALSILFKLSGTKAKSTV
jgi:hypothetical protein